MSLFDFFKKAPVCITEEGAIHELKIFSLQAVLLVVSEIEKTGTFSAFGAVVKFKKKHLEAVYSKPGTNLLDPEEDSIFIKKLITQPALYPNGRLWFSVTDDITGLHTGFIDCIKVRCGNKEIGVIKIFIYPYRILNGKVEFIDKNNPITQDI